jgi:hypothetical protein
MAVIWDRRMDAQAMMPMATRAVVRRFMVVASLGVFVGGSRSAPRVAASSGERPPPELLTDVW